MSTDIFSSLMDRKDVEKLIAPQRPKGYSKHTNIILARITKGGRFRKDA